MSGSQQIPQKLAKSHGLARTPPRSQVTNLFSGSPQTVLPLLVPQYSSPKYTSIFLAELKMPTETISSPPLGSHRRYRKQGFSPGLLRLLFKTTRSWLKRKPSNIFIGVLVRTPLTTLLLGHGSSFELTSSSTPEVPAPSQAPNKRSIQIAKQMHTPDTGALPSPVSSNADATPCSRFSFQQKKFPGHRLRAPEWETKDAQRQTPIFSITKLLGTLDSHIY